MPNDGGTKRVRGAEAGGGETSGPLSEPNDGDGRGTKRARGAEAGGGETSGPLSEFTKWQQEKTEYSHKRQEFFQRLQEQEQMLLNEVQEFQLNHQPTIDTGVQDRRILALESLARAKMSLARAMMFQARTKKFQAKIMIARTKLKTIQFMERVHTKEGSKILPQALVQCVGEPKFWQVALDGVLTLSSSSPNNHKNVPTAGGSQNSITRRLVEDGFACVSRCDKSDESELVAKLHAGAKQLHAMGLPPTFTTCYDAAWQLMQLHHDRTMKPNVPATHRRVGDVLCWCIPRGGAGFAPHSDRDPADVEASFETGGLGKMHTTWLALSECGASDGCLAVIPARFDPGYKPGAVAEATTSKSDGDGAAALWACLDTKESVQNIRALPLRQGEAVVFSHRLIHWAMRSDLQGESGPRVSLSWTSANPSFEAPYLVDGCEEESTGMPSPTLRIALACAQSLVYWQRFGVPLGLTAGSWYHALFQAYKNSESCFAPDYQKIVRKAFAEAVKVEGDGNDSDAKKAMLDVALQGDMVAMDDSSDDDSDDDIMDDIGDIMNYDIGDIMNYDFLYYDLLFSDDDDEEEDDGDDDVQ